MRNASFASSKCDQQHGAIVTLSIFCKLLAINLPNLPWEGRYGVSFVSLESGLFSISVAAFLHPISCYNWPHYNNTVYSLTFVVAVLIDRLVQDCSISIANTLGMLQSCTKPSTCNIVLFWTMLEKKNQFNFISAILKIFFRRNNYHQISTYKNCGQSVGDTAKY